MKYSKLAVLAVILNASDAFVVPNANPNNAFSSGLTYQSSSTTSWAKLGNDTGDNLDKKPSKLRRLVSNAKRTLAFVTMASSVMTVIPKSAQASAPVMAIPKAEARDPLTDALEIHQRKMQAKAQQELKDFSDTGRQIEATQGPEARERFEAEYKADQDKQAQERLDRIKKLKYDLLDQGICPFTDLEGQRRVFEAEKGLDPASVVGTRFNMEKEMEERRPEKSYASLKKHNREMIKAMVTDMKNRGMDPLEYFQKHQEKIAGILELPAARAAAYVTQYTTNLDAFGQITPPKEGEESAKEIMAKASKNTVDDKAAAKEKMNALKVKAKAAKAAAKQQAKEIKEKAKELKEKAKAEAKAAKEEAKKLEKAAKAAAAAAVAAAASAAVGASEIAGNSALELTEYIPGAADALDAIENIAGVPDSDLEVGESKLEESEAVVDAQAQAPITKSAEKKRMPIIPVTGGVVAVVGGGYAFKVVREKSAADEEERQRQFKLLMGGFSAPALEEVDSDVSDLSFDEERSRPIESPSETTPVPKKKKKRGVFGKKTNGRETDIDMLVSTEANAPDFAKLLAKILTYGAPGRFPGIIAMPGKMPLEEFDVDAACAMLTAAQEAAGISKEEAAEVFANVVNCMLIDIVDLASTSLKEKDEKLTVDAIGIVVDYMMHASSLYNSIAEGVVITPVTYGGDLRKGTLEQMFSAYAASGMTNFMNMDEDFENRVSLLQDVFQINEKKAEGLIMKSVQKNMMEALKSGEGLEGMDEMMKGMNMDALTGMPGQGEGEEMDPEQLKEMLSQLKVMKDAGAIPADQMKEVRDAFKEAYGSTIDDVIKEADAEGQLGSQDKELLALMKSVLYDE
jgi:hypothetical protein